MKKMEYTTPELQVIKMKAQASLLALSDGEGAPGFGGEGNDDE